MSAKDIMVSNIEKLLDRDERLNIIAMKSNNLNQHSKNIHYIAASIKKQERLKNMKMMMMIAAGIAIFLIIIFILVY